MRLSKLHTKDETTTIARMGKNMRPKTPNESTNDLIISPIRRGQSHIVSFSGNFDIRSLLLTFLSKLCRNAENVYNPLLPNILLLLNQNDTAKNAAYLYGAKKEYERNNAPLPFFENLLKKCLEFRQAARKQGKAALLPLRLPRMTAHPSQKCL